MLLRIYIDSVETEKLGNNSITNTNSNILHCHLNYLINKLVNKYANAVHILLPYWSTVVRQERLQQA